ncbi:hypothetical protein ACFOWB_06765 [Chenggangzhangella methanolivorans]|uniref:hypothetical protein n=1 Tax=Chenggangzhangella methanolivorans TaxID=1437009 RepID=UPI0036222C95
MRIGFAAAALLAMASSASAASLSGSPFAIDALTSRQEIRHSLFETRKGGFGVVMARDDGQTGFPDSTYLRLFDKKGKPLGKTFFVGRSKPAPGPSAGTFPAGALQLAGGKILVSYADHRMNTIYSWGGLFAQTVARGAPEGTERRVDTSESGTFEAGGLIGLSAGRGLAYWRISNSQTRQVEAYGRFVTKLNELDPIIFDFSREGRVLVDAAPYRSGFMLKQAASDETSGTASVFFQLYDSLGTPSGKEFRALDGGKIGEVPFVSAVGLPNGSIVVLRSLKSKGGAELTAQLHAANWKPKGKPKVIAKDLVRRDYMARALPNGDFLVGVTVPDGESETALKFMRFEPSLKQKGGPARISSVDGGAPQLSQMQMQVLATGDAVVLYTVRGKGLAGQLLRP